MQKPCRTCGYFPGEQVGSSVLVQTGENGEHWIEVSAEEVAMMLRQVAQCKERGFITEDGQVRDMAPRHDGTPSELMLSKDGFVVGHGAFLYKGSTGINGVAYGTISLGDKEIRSPRMSGDDKFGKLVPSLYNGYSAQPEEKPRWNKSS